LTRVLRLEVVAVALVLIASLGLRLVSLDRFIVSDETRWLCRSLGFREALVHGDWANTFRVGHPGVVTMWLGTFFISRDDAQTMATCRATDDARQLLWAGATPEEQTRLMVDLGEKLFQGRIGVAISTWLCIVAIYFLVRLSWGRRVAVLSLILVAFDPFYLALSRFLHTDAVLTSILAVSVLALVAAVQRRQSGAGYWSLVVLSGVTGGLAALQKLPGGVIGLFAALFLGLAVLRQGVRWDTLFRAIRVLVVWGLVAMLVYVALWPVMWVDPIGAVSKVLGEALGYAEYGHENRNYFLGQIVDDPGWGFYPLAILFRLSPLVLVGLAAALWWLVRGKGHADRRFGLAALLLFCVLFGIFMSLGAKKFDRYLLPAFPLLDIVAAAGFVKIANVLYTWLERRWLGHPLASFGVVCLVFLAVQVALILPHYPYYLTYYNPLLGGVRQAQKVLLIGWGEGYEKAAEYLNAKPGAQRLRVAVPSISTFAPLFVGKTAETARYSAPQDDYVVFYISHVQRYRYDDLMTSYFDNPQARPEYVVTLHGVEYVWVYPNTYYVRPLSYIEEHGQPDQEILLVNGDSLFAKHYQGALQVREFHSDWSPQQIAELLDDLPPGCQRVWYVGHPDIDPDAAGKLMQKRGLLVREEIFPVAEAMLYRPVEARVSQQLSGVRFGDLLLRSYGLTDPPPTWGQDGGIFLEWEALQPLEEDYAAFLHLYNAHGQRIAQGDALIVDEDLRPTSQWQPGEFGTALYHLAIPPGTPPGQYELEVGVYLGETGKRLPLLDSAGEPQGTATRLKVEVGAPTRAPEIADLAIPHLAERELVPQLKLLGYDVEEEALPAGQTVRLRLFWQALGEMEEDYRLQLTLQGPAGTVCGEGKFDLVSTGYPPTGWRPDDLFYDSYWLPIDAAAAPTGEMSLQLNLLSEDGKPVLTQPVEVARMWVQSLEPGFTAPMDIGERYEVNLGDKITMLGYDLDATPVSPGESVRVTVYWQARQKMETSYKVFVHLYDERGQIVAQRDRLPGLGVRPTMGWEEGEILADRYAVPLSADTPAGVYLLAVGFYDERTGERLAAYGPDGARLDQDRIFLGQVKVEP
jgi:4-amino-4-deoxy-L-arabinose transferase-like glycosyltransferase